ncbi:RagB/SusD family nutrient uptake outer membrane protein [Parasegetibacter sp. NRK P23]|uniref:RagB/SusD family nutrient uptake outer membrane protein n=1 Tax=Parasegetibacter sp. NRK P23 TaxID=2942999 RepID=UPI0020449371|nr:RagB/SusD family nutrient uptake outer membrane protein [Parasegetibacter sp. NRK P23]MCM5529511.1 RagB/SusD family nutrient uptake outer membrane protein [Parasegetibacter sp. NRK P23]
MKAKYWITVGLAGSIALTGCKKDFLEAEPSQFVSAEQLQRASEQDPGLLNGNIAGLYTTMYNTGVGGTTGHDDFGQKGIDIYTDMLCSDMVLGGVNYGWYETVARYQSTLDFTRNEAYIPWRYYYRIIFGANIIIDALGGTDFEPTEEDKRQIMGQSKAMRAYGYFYLSQLYAKEYGDGNAKTLPIYKDTKVPNQPKSTTKEVYDLMISDLEEAITYLDGFTRTTKDQVDQNVAKGLLAYVLASRGTSADWARVETLTAEITAEYPVTRKSEAVGVVTALSGVPATNPESGFNNIATASWIWGVDLTLASDIDLISWWGQVDYFTYSYAWAGDPKVMDRGLYNTMRTDDIRRGQFHSTMRPLYKFFAPARVIGGQRQVTTDLLYMRADEFYILNAEAKARQSRDNDARTALKNYLTTAERIADVSYIDALSGQSLLNEIYLQTRLEFWGEGKSYLAMKRNKATITRGTNHLFNAGQSYQYNANELTFLIPQAEVLNNPVLND